VSRRWTLILTLTVVASVLLGLGTGSSRLSLSAVWAGLWHPDSYEGQIVLGLRAPRLALAFLVGGSLAVSGASLQALLRNPLAEPYLLGLSSGAGLGAVLAIATEAGGPWAVPIAAFLGALATIGLVYRLSIVSGRRLDPRVLLLSGVVVGAFAGALMSAIMVLSDATAIRNAFIWLLGGFSATSWQSVAVFVVYAIVPLLYLFRAGRALDLLALGDEPALHLGVDVERTRRFVYLSTALLTAASVATCGVIGFVGLVAPHVVRLTVGSLHRTLLPVAFFLGGSFLVLSDVIARTAARPLELPVGVVTALVGVPLFAVLLRRTMA